MDKAKGTHVKAKRKFILDSAQIILTLAIAALGLASVSPSSAQQVSHSGTQVSLNGRTSPVAWSQWQLDANKGKVHTLISDAGVMQLLGVELLNTRDTAKQPVQWFSQMTTTPLVLNSWHNRAYRYLDVTDFAQTAGWQFSADGDTLRITTPVAKVKAIRLLQQPWDDGDTKGVRIVIDLDRPTPWQITTPTSYQEWAIAIDAEADPALIQQFSPSPSSQEGSGQWGVGSRENRTTPDSLFPTPSHLLKLSTAPTLSTISMSVPTGLSPRVSTKAFPPSIFIDIRPDAMVERDILWASGLRWRQQFVNLGASRFPVVWLELNPRAVGLTLKPIWSETATLVGTAPLLKTAQRYWAVAAINGGFFNRNNKLPLGAIRRDGRWFSSPILNRGAIAWNDTGQVKIGRLSLQETLITTIAQHLPLKALNSGYVQAGIARYSSEWGPTYTPLIDNEIIVVVQNNQVTAQLPGGVAGKTAFPIPQNGYLLALRSNSTAVNSLPVGTLVSKQSATQPAEFARYPQILGAGPLLLQNRQIVLDAKAEGFSDAFNRETAARSAIGTTASGTLMIAAVHNRAGGAGPSLTEIALIMQHLGCVDALNLDGGSSTSLYLGGQLLNRSPSTAARVHNGLGVFLQPRP